MISASTRKLEDAYSSFKTEVHNKIEPIATRANQALELSRSTAEQMELMRKE